MAKFGCRRFSGKKDKKKNQITSMYQTFASTHTNPLTTHKLTYSDYKSEWHTHIHTETHISLIRPVP